MFKYIALFKKKHEQIEFWTEFNVKKKENLNCLPIFNACIIQIKEWDKGVVFECQHLRCKSQEIEILDFTDFLRVMFSP